MFYFVREKIYKIQSIITLYELHTKHTGPGMLKKGLHTIKWLKLVSKYLCTALYIDICFWVPCFLFGSLCIISLCLLNEKTEKLLSQKLLLKIGSGPVCKRHTKKSIGEENISKFNIKHK